MANERLTDLTAKLKAIRQWNGILYTHNAGRKITVR